MVLNVCLYRLSVRLPDVRVTHGFSVPPIGPRCSALLLGNLSGVSGGAKKERFILGGTFQRTKLGSSSSDGCGLWLPHGGSPPRNDFKEQLSGEITENAFK